MWYKNLHHSKLSRYTQLLDTRAIVVEVYGTTLLALYILSRSTDCHVNVGSVVRPLIAIKLHVQYDLISDAAVLIGGME